MHGAFLLALLLRACAASFASGVEDRDVICFEFESAKRFAAGDFAQGFFHWVPPLYPLLLALLYGAVDDLEFAGRLLGCLAGALAVYPTAAIARTVGGARAAVLAPFFLAVTPFHLEWSVRVSPHALYALLHAIAFAAALRSWRLGTWRSALGAGAAAAAAYWVRQEIVILVAWSVALASAPMYRAIRRTRAEPIRAAVKRSLATVAGLALFLACISPIVLGTHRQTGHWLISSKGPASLFGEGRTLDRIAPENPARILYESRIIHCRGQSLPMTLGERMRRDFAGSLRDWCAQFLELVSKVPRVCGYWLAPLIICSWFGSAVRRASHRRGSAIVLGYVAISVAALSVYYDSPRLLLSLVPLLCAECAHGWSVLLERARSASAARARGVSAEARARRFELAATLALVLVATPFLAHVCAKIRSRAPSEAERALAGWIADRWGRGRCIMDPSGNVALAARGVPIVLPSGTSSEIFKYARTHEPPAEIVVLPSAGLQEAEPASEAERAAAAHRFRRISEDLPPESSASYLVYETAAH